MLNQHASLDSCQTSHANVGESGQVSCFSSAVLNWCKEDPQLYKYDVSEEEEKKETEYNIPLSDEDDTFASIGIPGPFQVLPYSINGFTDSNSIFYTLNSNRSAWETPNSANDETDFMVLVCNFPASVSNSQSHHEHCHTTSAWRQFTTWVTGLWAPQEASQFLLFIADPDGIPACRYMAFPMSYIVTSRCSPKIICFSHLKLCLS